MPAKSKSASKSVVSEKKSSKLKKSDQFCGCGSECGCGDDCACGSSCACESSCCGTSCTSCSCDKGGRQVSGLVWFMLGVLFGAVVVGFIFFYQVLVGTDYQSAILRLKGSTWSSQTSIQESGLFQPIDQIGAGKGN